MYPSPISLIMSTNIVKHVKSRVKLDGQISIVIKMDHGMG